MAKGFTGPPDLGSPRVSDPSSSPAKAPRKVVSQAEAEASWGPGDDDVQAQHSNAQSFYDSPPDL